MEIKSFIELDSEEKKVLYNYIMSIGCNHYFDSFKEMVKDYIGIVFNYGESHFSLWEDGKVKGTLAVITKEVREKGEAFITGINIKKEDSEHFRFLLERGLSYISTLKPEKIKVGVYTYISYLMPIVQEYGFKEVYKAMVMRHTKEVEAKLGLNDNMGFEYISEENKKLYQTIHNKAFLNSPNGSTMTDRQLEEFMNEYKSCTHLAGICSYRGEAAGIYELCIKNGTGWIEGIGVYPEFWGFGVGRAILDKSVGTLYDSGAKEVKLFVISSNTRAVELYERNGFKLEKITSTWFEKVGEDSGV